MKPSAEKKHFYKQILNPKASNMLASQLINISYRTT